MLDLRDGFGFDKKKADEGVNMVVGPVADTDYIVVRRTPNNEFDERIQELYLEHADAIQVLEKSDHKAAVTLDRSLYNRAMAEAVVVGFGPGITNEGKPLQYAIDTVVKLMEDYPDLRTQVLTFSRDRSNYPLAPLPINVEKIKKQ